MSIKKVVMTKQGKRFFVKDNSQDLHTQHGFVKAEDLKGAQEGQKLMTNTKKELFIFSPSFIDIFSKIKRNAQIIPLKDVGSIITETGLGSSSKVVDAGAGTGALACFLAHLVKEVITYDIREDFLKTVKYNIDFLGLKNVKAKKKDIYEGVDEYDADVITLDLPEPWKVLSHAASSLKPGGFVVSYSPSIPQTADFVNAVKENDHFVHVKTIEIIEREWEVEGRKVRPKTTGIGHSGFLSFARRLQ